MKIVDKTAFLQLSKNTLFSKYEPCCFGPLCIKECSLGNDFCYRSLADTIKADDCGDFCDRCENARLSGASIALDFERVQRDGMFDDNQLFAIWEVHDVAGLIAQLTECVKG